MTIDSTAARPPIVDRGTWLAARKNILGLEKQATKAADRASAARRRLPMTHVDNYIFDDVDGPIDLLGLFNGRSQLVVQHFMFDPD